LKWAIADAAFTGDASMSAKEYGALPVFASRAPLWDLDRIRFERLRLKHRWRLLKKWWFRRHKPYQPLFVIATCRSGSNLLLSYLGQQPGVAMLGEVLCALVPIGPRRPCIPPAGAVRHIRHCLQAERSPIRGCKLMLYQLANCQLTLNDINSAFPNAKYIIIYRQSLAEQFLSQKAAETTEQFVLRPGEKPRKAKLTINPDELRGYCDHTRNAYRDVLDHDWLRERSVLLSYEELTADSAYWLNQQICPLLNVPPVMPKERFVKQNTLPLAERVTNYREVASLLHSPLCRQYHTWPGEQQYQKRAA
jgi:LPS sulfotransferase NodH